MRRRTAVTVLVLAVLVALATSGPLLAQTSPSYNLEWNVIGGGGQAVTSTHYAVNSTVGQGAASPPESASTHYVVSGGYWFAGTEQNSIYLPLVLRRY